MAAMLKRLRTVIAVATLTVATYAAAVELRSDHPDTYVVQRGDTLWDIAGKFLQRPWLWPEIWQANPQIQNPHLIYPGDVISLAYLNRVAVQEGPREEAPVTGVPLSEIEPFLKNLRVVDEFAFGQDYAETLKRWRERFLAQRTQILQLGFDERFMHIWEFYLAYCEAAFAMSNIYLVQYTLAKD